MTKYGVLKKKIDKSEYLKTFDKNITTLEWLLQERAIQNEAAARYFNYMYSIIGFTFTLYCSIVAIFQDKLMNALNNQYIFLFLLGYALPIATYVLGLFYAYNAVAIYKFGYYSILLDTEIINLLKLTSKQRHIFRWGQSSIGEKSSPLIFAYGTMLMFYILLPPSMIVCCIHSFWYCCIKSSL